MTVTTEPAGRAHEKNVSGAGRIHVTGERADNAPHRSATGYATAT